MRRKCLALTVMSAAALVAPVLARADDSAVRKELMAVFNKGVTSYKKKDVKSFMSMFAPGYTSRSFDGRTMTRADEERDMKQAMSMTKSLDAASLSIEKLATKGNSADVTSTMKLSMHVVDDGTMGGKKGQPHVLSMEQKSKEIWVKTGGSWKIKSSQELAPGKTTIDGKVMPSQPAAPPVKAKPKPRAPQKARS